AQTLDPAGSGESRCCRRARQGSGPPRRLAAEGGGCGVRQRSTRGRRDTAGGHTPVAANGGRQDDGAPLADLGPPTPNEDVAALFGRSMWESGASQPAAAPKSSAYSEPTDA